MVIGMVHALALLVLAGYALSTWHLLRSERRGTLAWLALGLAVAAALRLVHVGDFPAYVSEDESKMLAHGLAVLSWDEPLKVFGMGEILIPILPSVLFQAPLVPWLGPTEWAMRTYSLGCSLLAVPIAFAAGRALGLRVASSLVLASFVATLGWALLYGRVGLGASLVLHQLLLLAAVGRLVFDRGGWPEVAIGTLALSLLLYDYHPGRVLVCLPVLGVALASGRQRILCAAIVAASLVAFLPHVAATSYAPFAFYQQHGGLHRLFDAAGLADLGVTLREHLRAFAVPNNTTSAVFSVRAGSWHPPLMLLLAVVGSLRRWRLALLLWVGFAATLVPAVLSGSDLPSSRRLLAAYPFMAIAAAGAIDLVRRDRARRWAAVAVAAAVAVQSVSTYFSERTWPADRHQHAEAQVTSLLRSLELPPPRPVLLSPDFGHHARPYAAAGLAVRRLTVDDWALARDGVVFGFGPFWAPLGPFFAQALGADRVESFGRAFRLDVPPERFRELERYGWRYDFSCGGSRLHGWLPTLYSEFLRFATSCAQGAPVEHRWRGRWVGPADRLKLRAWGAPTVAIERAGELRRVAAQGDTALQSFEFDVRRGDRLEVVLRDQAPQVTARIALFVARSDGAEILPAWRMVEADVTSSEDGDA